ncbi:uncharacterized protein LOC142333853 [Lycorma delicatula]|uniref:uncharacterized protein LOC142333853 n=1 Tax=Lycorma delicatula TaxID=130591 RepID=UPI003F51031D
MWRIQALMMYFILTTMLVGSNKICEKYRNGIYYKNENRNKGYTDKQTIQSHSNMYCEHFDKKPQRKIYHWGTCSKVTDKYLKLVGETEEDIKKFAEACLQRGFKWHVCINIMFFLEERCWDMHNATFLIELVQDFNLLMYIVRYTKMPVYYTAILRMKNFQPLNCIYDILHDWFIRDIIFVRFYYSWFKNKTNATGCDCIKVKDLYFRKNSDEDEVKLLESECLK